MRRLLCIFFATGLASVGISAAAMDDMTPQGMMIEMKAMDTNHDGMISKKEFMKFHEDMWAKMKKNKSGLVDIEDMELMHNGMMKDGAMKDGMVKDSPMKNGPMKDNAKK